MSCMQQVCVCVCVRVCGYVNKSVREKGRRESEYKEQGSRCQKKRGSFTALGGVGGVNGN